LLWDYYLENQKERIIEKNVKSIIISLGGSDTYGFTPKVIKALHLLPDDITISVILGPSFQHDLEIDDYTEILS